MATNLDDSRTQLIFSIRLISICILLMTIVIVANTVVGWFR